MASLQLVTAHSDRWLVLSPVLQTRIQTIYKRPGRCIISTESIKHRTCTTPESGPRDETTYLVRPEVRPVEIRNTIYIDDGSRSIY